MLRLLQRGSLTERGTLSPESFGLNLGEKDCTATVTARLEGLAVETGDWMQDTEGPGAGIVWRVRTVEMAYDTGTATLTLEHVFAALADRIIPTEIKPEDMGGSGGMCTAAQAVAYILSLQSDWQLGEFDYSSVEQAYRFSGDTLRGALDTVGGTLADPLWQFDYSSYPFTLSVTRRSDTVGAELRAGRNLTGLRVTVDRSRMYTRFYPVGKNNLRLPGTGYLEKNVDLYGGIEKTETDQSKGTPSAMEAWGYERLDRHAEPSVTVTASGLDLSRATGEPLDRLVIGTVCQIPLPEYGRTVREKITKLAWRDKIADPESCTVTLANAEEDVQTILKQQSASGGRAGRTAAELNEEEGKIIGDVESGLYTRILQTASELRAEAYNTAESLRSMIRATASDFEARVERVADSEGRVTAASIALAINADGSNAEIQANHVRLLGSSLQLNSVLYADTNGSVLDVVVGMIYGLGSHLAQIDNLEVRDSNNALKAATWQSQTVVTGVTITMPSISLSGSHDMVFQKSNGDYATFNARCVNSWSDGSKSVTTDTIYYLGRAGVQTVEP